MAIGTPVVTGYIPRIPTSGEVGYDARLNALLQALIDAVEARSGASGLDIEGDLTLNGNRVVDVLGVKVSVASTDPGVANSLFLSGSTPEWYLRDGSNNRIQVTSLGYLNVQGSGSIGGDYAGSSALAAYTNATSRFSFVSAPGVYADMENGGVLIHNGSSTGYIKLAAPTTQATNVTYTWPTAVAGLGRRVLEVDATGTMATTNWPALSGTVADGGSFYIRNGGLIASGSVTSSLPMQAPDYRYTTVQTQVVPAGMANARLSGPTWVAESWSVSTTTTALIYPLPVRVGDVITGWTLYFQKTSAAGTIQAGLYELAQTTGVSTQQGSTQSNAANNPGYTSFAVTGLSITVVAGKHYHVEIIGGGTTGDFFLGLEFTVKRP
jgi:hypothetical protein